MKPDPVRPSIGDAAADRRLDALRALEINAMRRVLLKGAPAYTELRFQSIAIRRTARAMPLEALPMPRPLRKAVCAAGRTRLGDLDGLTYREVHGRGGTTGQPMRELHGLLRIAAALDPDRLPLFEVRARARHIPLREVSMPSFLRRALDERGVRTVGQLAGLTPARLGPGFDGLRWKALLALVARARWLPERPISFVRAIDAAMDRLPPLRRNVLELRFGATGRPIKIRTIAARFRIDLVDPHRLMDRWTGQLASDAGPAVARALHELQERARKLPRGSRLSSGEVDDALGITASRGRRRERDFYLRLLSRLRPRVRISLVWGKRIGPQKKAAG